MKPSWPSKLISATMSEIDPLTPLDCDLRDFAFMPLDVQRLRSSDLASLEDPETCWAALLLWAFSWHQVPSASIFDDDRTLAAAAGYGRNVKGFLKIKKGALRGFIRCSDGRLYHPIVAEKAREAWARKQSYKRSGSAGAASRWGTQPHGNAIGNAIGDPNGNAMLTPMAKNGNVTVTVTGTEKKAKAEQGEKAKSVSKSQSINDFKLTPHLRTWAKEQGWENSIDAHFQYFVDYLKAQPKNRYKDLEAAFRNCVRGDWGSVRRNGIKTPASSANWWERASGVEQAARKLGMKWAGANVEAFTEFALRVKERLQHQDDKPP